jgi:hypothetical protein
MEKLDNTICAQHGYRGSALILAVVLTSLLAVVGVLFIMMARVDTIATSAVSENRELNFAVDSVIAQINEQLVLDVPGVAGQEYYDYPDQYNTWLANLEPYKSGTNYFWSQISDITGALAGRSRNVQIKVISESDKIVDSNQPATIADADGDGVGDSIWVKLPNITSGKGKPIYAAVRIIDNSAMLNVNTGFKFDPASPVKADIDGHTQLQINVKALAGKPSLPATIADETALLLARANYSQVLAPDLDAYESRVIWNFLGIIDPNRPFTPFDLSDELELRFRYLLNHTGIDTRLENWGRFRDNTISTPVTSGGQDLDNWFKRVNADGSLDPNYAYRHITTTNNMDRIINPQGGRMVNVNNANMEDLYSEIYAALLSANPNLSDADIQAIRMTVNITDYIDDDSQVTVYSTASSDWYGFERPCIYISELACMSVRDQFGIPHTSYAIELFKPYFEDNDPPSGEWQLAIDYPVGTDVNIPITWSGTRRFHVILVQDSATPLPVSFSDPQEPIDTKTLYNYNSSSYARTPQVPANGFVFDINDTTIYLQRRVSSQRGTVWIPIDSIKIPPRLVPNINNPTDTLPHTFQRDISKHKCIRRLWDTTGQITNPTLGSTNGYIDSDTRTVQAHPANQPLTDIGELGMILRTGGYNMSLGATADDLLINLQDPNFANLFQYLTVIDPWEYLRSLSETRVKGRININTAPWFVIAQLPWDTPEIARAIVAYRDKLPLLDVNGNLITNYAVRRTATGIQKPLREDPGFASIGELATVVNSGDNLPINRNFSMRYYSLDRADQLGFPDLTPGDDSWDDFEERDLIFSRISNLVTVRSDIFTAYILVRLGLDGPQKRVIAILDRSLVKSPSDNVRVLAVHLVPDPR